MATGRNAGTRHAATLVGVAAAAPAVGTAAVLRAHIDAGRERFLQTHTTNDTRSRPAAVTHAQWRHTARTL